MNKNLQESLELANGLNAALEGVDLNGAEVVVTPTYTNLYAVTEAVKGGPIRVAAQNLNENESGAYTGEISASMLESVGVKTVILGHSERREYYGETDELLANKTNTALSHGFEVIFCIGEVLEERKSGKHFDVVTEQISKGLFHLEAAQWDNIVLAYEPVWAIGTGETATPDQAQEMHAHIRKVLTDKYGEAVAAKVPVLYGGSCNPKNAEEIFSKEDVDGGLIGGASLKVEDFKAVITSF